jgi:hypothetical protein
VSGTYESAWQDISDYLIKNSVTRVKNSIPNDSTDLGKVHVDNVQLQLRNVYGETSDENNAFSFFNNWQRHGSQVKVVEGYIDKYTDPENWVEVENTTFIGLIDDRQAVTTKEYIEQLTVVDKLSILSNVLLGELGTIASTTIDTIVYEILNRAAFTKYFTVLPMFITSGYNASSVDMTQYTADESVYNVLQDLAKGHAIMYVNPDDDIFYWKAISLGDTRADFNAAMSERLELDNYSNGSDKVIEKWYWEGTNINYDVNTPKFYTHQTFNIKGVTNTVERTNMLNYVRGRYNTARKSMTVRMPYLPIFRLLDGITVFKQGLPPPDAFILGVGRLGIDRLRLPIGAVRLTSSNVYIVRGIEHSFPYTCLEAQEAINDA